MGFLFVLFLILFPGIIFRRFYFYGEFSKEFSAGKNLIGLLAASAIPGLIILFVTVYLYSYIFVEVNTAEIIDKYKEINDPDLKISGNTKFNSLLSETVCPFIFFQYLISSMIGVLSGRGIRISRLDTKFKLLRFKNYWFYIFSGEYNKFKKFRHLKPIKKKHLFTKADVLIDSDGKALLYSGFVVDYELCNNDCTALSKIYLENAERYSIRDNTKTRIPIPGTIFIVDCSSMKNINLTYVYESQKKSLYKAKLPASLELGFGIIIIILIPLAIFKIDLIDMKLYNDYFNLVWYEKILVYFASIQAISLLNPFVKIKDEYKYITFWQFFYKLLWIFALMLLVLIF